MSHGGSRKGAGRRPGATQIRSREVLDKYTNDGGKLPLDVLMAAMREADEKGETELAAAYAKDAAPYFHAKLANMEVTGTNGGPLNVNILKYADHHASGQ